MFKLNKSLAHFERWKNVQKQNQVSKSNFWIMIFYYCWTRADLPSFLSTSSSFMPKSFHLNHAYLTCIIVVTDTKIGYLTEGIPLL